MGIRRHRSPLRMDPLDLEATLAWPEARVEEAVAYLLEGARGIPSAPLLLTGPHGIGKTHLLRTLMHRVRGHLPGGLVAWSTAPPYARSGDDAVLGVLANCAALRACIEEVDPGHLQPGPHEPLTDAAVDAFRGAFGAGPMVLFVDDLDAIAHHLSSADMRRFFSILSGPLGFQVAGALHHLPSSLENTPQAGAACRQWCLDELGYAAAHGLYAKRRSDAGEVTGGSQDTDLERYQALYVLLGGSPGIVSLCAEAVDAAAPVDGVAPLEIVLDHAGMAAAAAVARLTPQQQSIVQYLASRDLPVPARDIARHCRMTPQTATGQLKALRAAGSVAVHQAHGAACYEVHEPVMRAASLAVRHAPEALQEHYRFVRLWFEVRGQRVQPVLPAVTKLVDGGFLLDAAMRHKATKGATWAAAEQESVQRFLTEDAFARALLHAQRLMEERGAPWEHYVAIYLHLRGGAPEEALQAANRVIRLRPQGVLAGLGRAVSLLHRGQYAEGLETLDPLPHGGGRYAGDIWAVRAALLAGLRQWDKAQLASAQARDNDFEAAETLSLLLNAWAGRWDAVVAAYPDLTHRKGETPVGLLVLGHALARSGDLRNAVRAFERAEAVDEACWQPPLNRAVTLERMHLPRESADAYAVALQRGCPRPEASFATARLAVASGEQPSIPLLRDALGRHAGDPPGVARELGRLLATGDPGMPQDLGAIAQACEASGTLLSLAVACVDATRARQLRHERLDAWLERLETAALAFPSLSRAARMAEAVDHHTHGEHAMVHRGLSPEERRFLAAILAG